MLKAIGTQAKTAARQLARTSTQQKNQALNLMAENLLAASATILAANALDVEQAQAANMEPHLIDRLLLNEKRLAGIAADLRSVAQLPDPVDERFDEQILPNGLKLRKQRVPLGVLGVIYEARPNVTMDIAGLALKSGNAAILRGGSETLNSNRALVGVIHAALHAAGLPTGAVQFIDSADRALVLELLQLADSVDIIIPRGGSKLHEFCRANSRVPVMTGGIGICHLFVDATADLEKSLDVIYNAKTQRPTVCNALDTVLVHRAVADEFLPRVVDYLRPAGVTFRAHETAHGYVQIHEVGAYLKRDAQTGEERVHYASGTGTFWQEGVQAAGPDDFDTEWLSLVLGLKVVDSLDEALAHIAAHSTGHSDGILTDNAAHAQRFTAEVDSAAVYVNASTRFTDGSEFGLGAEVAVSTQRLHARGPMGLRELTTYKWVAEGEYHVRP